jgi:hypothetical protein
MESIFSILLMTDMIEKKERGGNEKIKIQKTKDLKIKRQQVIRLLFEKMCCL